MRIGVFGATGRVGKGVLKVLEREKFQVTAFYRNPVKARELQDFQSEKFKISRLDLEDSEALDEACEECDLLINCAGPSDEIKDRIAVRCIEKGKKYLDVAGGKVLKEKIEQNMTVGNNCCCVLGAGIYPGLTEVFAAAVARKYPSLKELKLYFYGNSPLSETAAYDIVAGMEDSSGGMCYVKDGKAVKISGIEKMGGEKQPPFDHLVTMPVLGDEFREMAFKEKIPEACFFHSFSDNKELMDFVMIKAMQKYRTKEGKAESAKLIQQTFYSPEKRREVILLAEYVCEGEERGWIRLWSDEDWSLITGYVAAFAATELIRSEKAPIGVFYLEEIIDAEKLLESLSLICKFVVERGKK